jgi:hypothetical protein
MEAKERKDRHDDDDQTDEVNYSIHERSPGRVGDNQFSLSTRTPVPTFRSFFQTWWPATEADDLCCTAPLISVPAVLGSVVKLGASEPG